MSVTIHDTITPGLKALIGKVGDKRPILEAMGTELQKITQGSFNNAAWRVTPWANLAPSTIRSKRNSRMKAPLKRTGQLWKNWSLSYTPSTVTLHSGAGAATRPYAAFHQFGTSRLPARPMLPFIGGPEDAKLAPWARAKLSRIAQAKLNSLLKGSA